MPSLAASIPVTLLYGGLCTLLLVGLGLNVSRMRFAARVRAGDPLPAQLARPVRAHGNGAEWIPLGIALLLALELSRAGTRFTLHLLGGSFFLARVLHAAGMHWRFRLVTVGAALNYTVLTVMGVWALRLRFGG
jgi:uncharacterized membrane protein YecN with MAPEG domain